MIGANDKHICSNGSLPAEFDAGIDHLTFNEKTLKNLENLKSFNFKVQQSIQR